MSTELSGRCPNGHLLHPGVPAQDCAQCGPFFAVLETKEHGRAYVHMGPDPDTVLTEAFPWQGCH
jgi:hypothetical protein